MEAYRRIAGARDRAQLAKVRTDLESAYGAPPAGVETLLELAEVRLAATLLGVRAVLRREQDLVLKALDAPAVAARFKGIRGTVRVVGEADERGLTDVYVRPAAGTGDGRAVLSLLRRRLVDAAPPAVAGA
jgi:hypothetical protein